MARFDKVVDLYWTDSGDFALGTNGDFEDTMNEHYRGFLQRVLTRLRSKKREWRQQPGIGADIGSFIGKPNTAEIGLQIREQVFSELVRDDLLRGSEFIVDVLPIGEYEVAIAIVITPPRAGGQIVLTLTYNTHDNRLTSRNL